MRLVFLYFRLTMSNILKCPLSEKHSSSVIILKLWRNSSDNNELNFIKITNDGKKSKLTMLLWKVERTWNRQNVQECEYSDVGVGDPDGDAEDLAMGTVVSTGSSLTYRPVCCSHALHCRGWTGESRLFVVFVDTFDGVGIVGTGCLSIENVNVLLPQFCLLLLMSLYLPSY